MSKTELLNNIKHKELRVNADPKKEFGDSVAGSIIYPFEFSAVHKEYPIFFQKSQDTGEFQAVAFFGFEENENLFLGECWEANYIPALFRREPFLIGFQQEAGAAEPNMVVHVDLDSPRISTDDTGKAVFLEGGGNSPYLDEVRETLLQIHTGVEANKRMMAAFLDLDLIERFTLDVTFSNEKKLKTDMFYTINREKLFALSGATVESMHKSGLLQLAYMAIDSLSNIKTLIKRKEARLAVK